MLLIKSIYMKHTMAFLLFISLLTSCKKEENSTLYMSGYIYNNCYDKVPVQNSSIRLYRTKFGTIQGGEVVATGTTDANGFFKISFPQDNAANWMKLQTSGGGDLMEKIPPDKNYNNVEVFTTIFANINVSLNVINPHNVGDTLVIGNFSNGGGELKIPCPLSSGPIYTATDWNPLAAQGYEYTEEKIAWTFRPSTGFVYVKSFKIDKYCQDTIYMTVDIN